MSEIHERAPDSAKKINVPILTDCIEDNVQKTHTVLSVNEYTPFEKYNFKQYLNEQKFFFQNFDKTKFNITSV